MDMNEFEAERKWAEKQFLTELRDDFAMAAITGILAGKWGQMPQYKPEQAFADFAYRIADEMIKRRTQDVDDETK
jgi:ABC-type xylose transport system substrate-binding protein